MALIFPTVPLDGAKALLVDIDNTLYEYAPAHQLALAACFAQAKADGLVTELDEVGFDALYRRHRVAVKERLSPQGVCRSRALAFLALFEERNVPSAYVQAIIYDALYWDTFISVMHVELQALALLRKAKQQGLKIIAVTDMLLAVQVRKLQKLGLAELIDGIVTSEEAGAEKPAAVMFRTALTKAGVEAHEAIMIGDDLKKDIDGARSLGIAAYQVMND